MDLRFIYVSPSSTRVTGYTPEEAMTRTLDQLLTPESFSYATRRLAEELTLLNTLAKMPDQTRPVTLEIEAVYKNGGTFWLEVTGTFNRNSQGVIKEILAVGRNITERKKVQNALHESEKRYRMIVDNMQDTIWTMDFNLQYTYLSPAIEQLTGYTIEEIKKIPLDRQLTPSSMDVVSKVFSEEFEPDYPLRPKNPSASRRLELEVLRKDGSILWQELTLTFKPDDQGNPIEILGVARDISERKKSQTVIADSEKRYRMIVENMQDVICIMDFNFRFLYVSNSNIKLSGYTKDEVKDIPIEHLLTPQSLERITSLLSEELEHEKSQVRFENDFFRTIELELRHKEGGTTWAEVTATFNRNQNGEPVEILLAARDITARRRIEDALLNSEKRYRMIVENMHEIIWTTDLNMQNTYVSPSCFPLTGYTPEELMLLSPDHLFTPESLSLAASTVSEELAIEFSGEPSDPQRSRTIEQEIFCKGGGTISLDVTVTFIRDENCKPIGMLMAGRDITLRKRAEEEKEKLEAQLMQAQKMETVGRLAGGVAHDFNNMLSVILGYVDLARLRLAKQHPVLSDIAEIEKAAIRSRDITTQLLAFSRKQVIEPKIIDLNDLVSHTEKALIRLIGEDIELKVLTEENLWAILFDPSQIEQILINLAVNARDAMPDGGKLTIETENLVLDDFYCRNHADSRPGSYVRLTVSDNGTGMDKDTLRHIFEPFFTTKEAGKGTGLGLATVYGIVKQNEGFINVYSEPGRGTTFSIYLSRTTETGGVQEDAEEEPQLAGAGKILLVEDDALVLQITKSMLESIGYSVTAADTPGEALFLFEKQESPFDLVITDVIMPAMSGKELKSKVLKIRPDTKVLFMSGYTADVIAHHGVLEDGVHFLQKPFTIRSLAVKVNDVLAKSAR
jgi:PAS domain S-box-containing protein